MRRFHIIILFFALFFNIAQAKRPLPGATYCGIYQIYGKIRAVNSESVFFLVVHEGTKSEYQLKIPISSYKKIYAFIDDDVLVKASLLTSIQFRQGNVHKIFHVESVFTNKNAIDDRTGFTLLEKKPCQK